MSSPNSSHGNSSFKTCSFCLRSLPLPAFHRNSSSSDGRGNICRECARNLKARRRAENTSRLANQAAESFEEFYLKEKARGQANAAFAPWGPCAVLGCGRPGRKHHIDYADPFAVIYLCDEHHSAFHNTVRSLHILAKDYELLLEKYRELDEGKRHNEC